MVACYSDALESLRRLHLTVSHWDVATPCAEWRLIDLAGHLVAISRYWHRLLDASEAGQPRAGLPRGRSLEEMNAQDLLGLPESGGPERVEIFLELATAHLRRVEGADWETPLGEWSEIGPLTIGQHSGVAIGEWHVHAWDIARSIGADHRPIDPVVVAEGNKVVRAVSAGGDAWSAVLMAYGRDPDWRSTRI